MKVVYNYLEVIQWNKFNLCVILLSKHLLRRETLRKLQWRSGNLEGDIGDIQTIKIGTLSTIRDISIQCSNEEHLIANC